MWRHRIWKMDASSDGMWRLVYVERSGTAAPRRCRVHKKGASRIFSAGHGGQKHLHRRCTGAESLKFKHPRKSDIAALR